MIIIIKLTKYESHQHKSPISIKNVDINKILVSNKFPFGKQDFKYFIGCKDLKNWPLCILLPKMSANKRNFDKTKSIFFL